jgi:hypothetical protein
MTIQPSVPVAFLNKEGSDLFLGFLRIGHLWWVPAMKDEQSAAAEI